MNKIGRKQLLLTLHKRNSSTYKPRGSSSTSGAVEGGPSGPGAPPTSRIRPYSYLTQNPGCSLSGLGRSPGRIPLHVPTPESAQFTAYPETDLEKRKSGLFEGYSVFLIQTWAWQVPSPYATHLHSSGLHSSGSGVAMPVSPGDLPNPRSPCALSVIVAQMRIAAPFQLSGLVDVICLVFLLKTLH